MPRSTIQSVDRASAVLDAVVARAVRGARLSDVQKATGLNRATAHRMLKSLVEVGLLEKDEYAPVYFPGIKLVSLASRASNRFGLVKQSAAGRARIAERTCDTVFLQLRVGYETVCIARSEGSFPIKALTLDVGERRPIGIGAGGLAILSALDEDEAAELIDSEGHLFHRFNMTRTLVIENVKRAQDVGFAVDEDGVIPGITGVAVPIIGGHGNAIAALTVAAISDRLSGLRRGDVAVWLQEECGRIHTDIEPMLTNYMSDG